jgi:ketosteroid isomerase-like protein
MRIKSWIFVLLLPIALIGSPAGADDLRAAMEANNKAWLDAFNTPTITAFPAMYTADAILIPGGMGPAAIGPEAITKFWEGAIKAGFKDHTFEIMETRAEKSSSEESTVQGHTLRVLVKQSDGTWQTKVHTFVPLPPPTPQEAKK